MFFDRMTTAQALDLLKAYGYRATAFNGEITVQDPVVTLGTNGAPNVVTYRPYSLSPDRVRRFIAERN